MVRAIKPPGYSAALYGGNVMISSRPKYLLLMIPLLMLGLANAEDRIWTRVDGGTWHPLNLENSRTHRTLPRDRGGPIEGATHPIAMLSKEPRRLEFAEPGSKPETASMPAPHGHAGTGLQPGRCRRASCP